jgi:CubicO group peptidase (beta-lactamase class C family)
MTKLFSVVALLSVLGLSSQVARANPTPELTGQDLGPFFGGLIPYSIERGDIAGGVITVVKDDKVILAKGYGYADKAKRTPVLPDETLFRAGSISKLFTWTAVMQLVEQGKLNLDRDVNDYLDFKIPAKYGAPITLRDLMTHSAGFSETIRGLLVTKASELAPLRTYLVEHLPDRMYPPGKVIAYSNYGATLAGYIVQRVSGEPFETYIANHIFKPLGMNHSSFLQPLPKRLIPFMSKGYTTASASKPGNFEFVGTVPAGALSTTATDMAKFMLAYLQGGEYGGHRILKPSTIEEMWTLQIAPAPGINGFDLGFYQENRNGLEIVGHGGDTELFHSDLHLIPKEHVGVFMSFNSAGKEGASADVRTAIFRAFLNRYFPYKPPVQRTVSDPKRDAARVTGWYQSSRREDRALLITYAMEQSNVTARPDGTIEVNSFLTKDLAGNPLRWREVGPLDYKEIGGQAHLQFVADRSGRILSWGSDEDATEVEQRVDGLKTWGSLKNLLTLLLIILVLSLVIGIGTWIARWRLGIKLDLTRTQRWIRALARIGAIMFLIDFVAWPVTLGSESTLLSPSLGSTVTVLYIVGVLAILGGLAMIAEAILRIVQGPGGPGGYLVMAGKGLLALCAIYGIWVILAFGLANFVTNF